MTRVKICGVTAPSEAAMCIACGADAVGINLVRSSARFVDVATARSIAREVGSRAVVVAIVADMTVEAMTRLRDEVEASCLQLHGAETPADVAALQPHAYKAIAIATAADVERARSMPGDYVLVDAKVDGTLGGTGRTFDWELVVALARRRRVVLAGGLTSTNVGQAIARVRPWCVDVASGVETAPRVKDEGRVQAFIQAVREADAASRVSGPPNTR